MGKNILKMYRSYLNWRKTSKHFDSNITIMDFESTIDAIVTQKKSVARFGDGELDIINDANFSLPFQENSESLRSNLKKILSETNDQVLIGIPHYFARMEPSDSFKTKLYWYQKINTLNNIAKSILGYQRQSFADTQFTRVYMDTKKTIDVANRFKKIRSIWNNKHVLIIEGEGTKFGLGNDLLEKTKSISRIIIPAEHAFRKYDEILRETLIFIRHHENWNGVVLICAGPTATVLANDLGKRGIQSIDIGHLDVEYEWFNMRSKNKQAITGKYVNEVNDGRQIDDIYSGPELWKKISLTDY